jgi:gliding motility-associated-like protein
MFRNIQNIACSLCILLSLCPGALFAQNSCPPNIDFEAGDFTNWECSIGSTYVANGQNVVSVSPSGPILNRHTMITPAYVGVLDPYGNFPVQSPNGSSYSIKLGNSAAGSQAERVSYTFTISPTQNDFSLIYYYAVVFQDPQHQPQEQPRFTARVFDNASGDYISCGTFNYVATSNLPGFQQSTRDFTVWYKTWTPVTLDLSGLAGRTVTIEFTTADCTLGGHFGYAYVDVNATCSTPVVGAAYCAGAQAITLTAPYGFQGYNWYNNDFSVLLGSSQSLVLSPPPPVGTVIALEVIPFIGLGCRDTVFSTLHEETAVVNAGADVTGCAGIPQQIGSLPLDGYSYSWSPATGLSNPNISNPVARPNATTQYIVTATNPTSGCTRTDSVWVTVYPLPTSAFTPSGLSTQCFAGNNFSFVNNNSSSLAFSWDFDDTNYSNAQSPSHSYLNPGSYNVKLVSVNSDGCKDSTIKPMTVLPTPSGSIAAAGNYVCEGIPTVLTATGGASYKWYKDGVLQTTTTGNYDALQAGIYTAEIATAQGCTNMASNNVTLSFVKKPAADFSFDKYCIGLPTVFRNNSSVTGSLAVDYTWSFGNGSTATTQDAITNYTEEKTYNVQLTVTPQACPAIAATKQTSINVESPKQGISYFPLNAIESKPLKLEARSFGNNYSWTPARFLSNPTLASPIYLGTQEQLYQVKILTAAGCTTVDSQFVRIFKETEIYVPKAFTPNGDGQNDVLYPFLVGIKEFHFFRVVNRWGVVVFQTKTDQPGWDGKYKGAPQPVDGYSWEAEGIDIYGKLIQRKGTVTLIR